MNTSELQFYTEADFEVPQSIELPSMRTEKLAEFVKRVVEIEGPVHRDEVARRLSTLWGNQRMGSRIEAAISQTVDHLCRKRSVEEADKFLFTPGQQANKPRNRECTKSANLRKPEFLPPQDIRSAIEYSVSKYAGLFHEELAEAVARLFVFKTTTAKLRERIECVMQGLVNDGVI